jgi:hypothetical protein
LIASQEGDFASFKTGKGTNLTINDATCLPIVRISHHPTSHPTTMLTHTTMVHALKKNISPLPAGKYNKWTQRSPKRCNQANEGKSRLQAGRVQALVALHSFQSKKKPVAEK